MARKIRKSQRTRMSLQRLFIILVIPWIVLGVVALALFSVGVSDYIAIIVGLGASLLVTYIIRENDVRRRRA